MKAFSQLVIALAAIVLLLCCTNQEETEARVPSTPIFAEYSFWAEEDKDFITGLFQFRMNGIDNIPSRLILPAKLELDGQEIRPDSAGLSGSFYEINKPLDSFTGEHTIVLTTGGREKITEKFTFAPFQLLTDGDTVLSREDMLLRFQGLRDGERIRIVMTDTSFRSNGINEVVTVRDNQVDIRPRLPGNIKNGPVVLHIFREEERMIERSAIISGKLSVTYSLKKEFQLVD